jgi:hypothetical protein
MTENTELTACSRILKKLTVSQLVKKFPTFMDPEVLNLKMLAKYKFYCKNFEQCTQYLMIKFGVMTAKKYLNKS